MVDKFKEFTELFNERSADAFKEIEGLEEGELGEKKDGQLTGPGVWVRKDVYGKKNVHIGCFENGELQGKGIIYCCEGVVCGEYKDGELAEVSGIFKDDWFSGSYDYETQSPQGETVGFNHSENCLFFGTFLPDDNFWGKVLYLDGSQKEGLIGDNDLIEGTHIDPQGIITQEKK